MDHNRIQRRAETLDDANDVTMLAVRTNAALISYFDGEDLTGKIRSPSIDVLAAFLTLVNGEGQEKFTTYQEWPSIELENRLTRAFISKGFEAPDGSLRLPEREDYDEIPSQSVGPLLPTILAILEVEYGINSLEAANEYREDALK